MAAVVVNLAAPGGGGHLLRRYAAVEKLAQQRSRAGLSKDSRKTIQRSAEWTAGTQDHRTKFPTRLNYSPRCPQFSL